MCDVEYSYAVDSLTAALQKTYQCIIPTVIQTESKLQSTLDQHKTPSTCASHAERQRLGKPCCGKCKGDLEDVVQDKPDTLPAEPLRDMSGLKEEKKKGGRYFELPENVSIDTCSIFFVGEESLTLTNIMMVHNKCPVS